MNRTHRLILILLVAAMLLSSCAYRHYLGMAGPSINTFPEVHQGVTEDSECLDCHAPGHSGEAPPTSHPGFKGCLRCHNSPVK